MTSRTSLLAFAIVCALQPLCFAPPLAARQGAGAGSAGPSCQRVDPPGATSPTITGLRIVSITGPPDCKGPRIAPPPKQHGKPRQDQESACADLSVSPAGMARFELAILGTHLLRGQAEPTVQLNTQDAGKPIVEPKITYKRNDEIDVAGDAPLGTVVKVVKVGDACNDTFSVAFTAKTGALQKFQIKLDHQTNAQFPNLHSLLLTKQGGDGGFDAKPSHMTVDLQPTGATDLRIVESAGEQLDLHFVAAATYVPTNAVVTVYDSGDLDSRKPIAMATPAAADPNAPTIASIETVFLDRGNGNGRIRIHGKGFGKQASASFPVDEYLCDCLERPQIDGYRACGFLDDVRGLPVFKPDPGGEDSPEAETSIEDNNANKKTVDEQPEKGKRLDELAASRNEAASEELGHPTKLALQPWSHPTDSNLFCQQFGSKWAAFQATLRGKVSVGIDSMNPAVRVQMAYIVDFNDQVIDVYFEFTRHRGYAWPFRLGNVTVAVTKNATTAQQTVNTPSCDAEVDKTGPAAFSVSQIVGLPPDPNLTYQYTVLNQEQSKILLGEGVADHFFVLQLAVVNHGTSQIAVPLAAMQAEVEWLRGAAPAKKRYWPHARPGPPQYFIEGPPTVAPQPVAAVSAYFGDDQKTGRRPSFFNILGGISTLVATLVPFAGPGLKDAQSVFSGGFVPALGQTWVDLSAQQLQTMTSLSWESSETIPAGGSMAGYIYIQRRQEEAGDLEPTTGRTTVRQISNVMALNVTGFPVSSTSAVAATPATTPATAAPGAAASAGGGAAPPAGGGALTAAGGGAPAPAGGGAAPAGGGAVPPAQ
jgi:hypothetical protein